jgi:shikimate dehydrogenase
MQNAGIRALGLDWRYLAFEVYPELLPQAIQGAQAMHFLGLNLTVPHKLLAVPLVDHLDDSARRWGAVNTIRFEGQTSAGTWSPLREFDQAPRAMRSVGFNTDADAIVRAVREDLELDLQGKTVLVLGAGGAGRTAALRLSTEGIARLFLVNRTLSKAAEIAQEINNSTSGSIAEVGYPEESVDLVINATSVGLRSDDVLPFNSAQFQLSRARAAFDMIYRPAETPFLETARLAGCRTANGLGMLLYQGAAALELWSGQPAPVEVMRRALVSHIYG